MRSQNLITPDKLWGNLFEDVQLKRVFPDNKTFADAVPILPPTIIITKYNEEKNTAGFDLDKFVHEHFIIPATPVVKVEQGLSLIDHLNQLWNVLQRKADVPEPNGSLLPLPKPYIVPGGRFREIYYWDSYFTMQGLAVSNRYDLIESMVDNFKWLIDQYGHIPNGNRNYFLSRSQPPYFALMVDLLREKRGSFILKKYFTSLEREYQFWMEGEKNLKPGSSYRRLVKLDDGAVLNRYWDDKNAPREESYAEDVALAKDYQLNREQPFVNLRASAESGWDFSSRWFADTMHLNTIETTNIIPVDLNCLLYAYETILSKAAAATGSQKKSLAYKSRAAKRKEAVIKYCWDNGQKFFFDYQFKEKKQIKLWVISGAMPLFTQLATAAQAAGVKKNVEEKFLKSGGVTTSLYHTGQQWDSPNGWAPLEFLTVKGLLNYKYNALAKTIALRWMSVNEKVFSSTGKMMEKYNVEDTNLESGGGEYPAQDGFGWTNGVYLKFHQLFKDGK